VDILCCHGAWGLPSFIPPETCGKSRTRRREKAQFVDFCEEVNKTRPQFLNIFRIRPQGIKNADKKTATPVVLVSTEALMKTMELQPTLTLAFTLGTRMRDLHDTIISTVLQQTGGNRMHASKLLHINPRTIRRRLGKKKEGVGSVTRAA
jgi:DNA-binding NtrC family response regulator